MKPKKMMLAENVKRLMEAKYPNHSNRTKALADDSGVGKSSIQRLLTGDNASNLDTLEALAGVFGITVGELIGEDRPAGVDIDQSSLKILKRLSRDALALADAYQLLPPLERVGIRQSVTRTLIPLIKESSEIEAAVIELIRS